MYLVFPGSSHFLSDEALRGQSRWRKGDEGREFLPWGHCSRGQIPIFLFYSVASVLVSSFHHHFEDGIKKKNKTKHMEVD